MVSRGAKANIVVENELQDSDEEASVEIVRINSAVHGRANTWILDSGASVHISCDKLHFTTLRDIKPIRVHGFGKNMHVVATKSGDITLTLLADKKPTTVLFRNVLYVPESNANIISSHQLMKSNITLIGKGSDNCFTLHYENRCIGTTTNIKGQFILHTANEAPVPIDRPMITINATTIAKRPPSLKTWHRRDLHSDDGHTQIL